MKTEPVQVDKYGRKVWCNAVTDELRKTDCLCLNCKALGDCHTSEAFNHISKESGVVVMITRCPIFKRNI